MKALGLIINREYMSRVRTKAFILTTLLVPFLLAIISFLPAYLLTINDTKIETIYVIDHTGKYHSLLSNTESYTFVHIEGNEHKEKMDALLQIDKDLSKYPLAATFFSEQQQPPGDLIRHINRILSDAVKSENIDHFTQAANIEPELAVELQTILKADRLIKVNTFRWQEDGETADTMGALASATGMILTFSMFFFIMTYGSLVMQSVVEEKSNKIVEVIISSVKPFELMLGKIIGVGLTGITQLFIWTTLGWLIVLLTSLIFGFGFSIDINNVDPSQMSSGMAEMTQDPDFINTINELKAISWTQVIICFILYFIGGYFMFASLFAMFGSAANDAQEAQQLTIPVTVILMLTFYVGFVAARNPEGDIAFWCSLIPITSPIVMIVRTPFEIPIWELALSLVLLFSFVVLTISFAARIYRVGILMHGKKIQFTDLIKWYRY